MAAEFYELLESIRNCKSYDEVKNHCSTIVEKKTDAADPILARALRDAQVYALVWGVYVASLNNDSDSADYADAVKAITDDAANAIAGENGSDAIADNDAVDIANNDVYRRLIALATPEELDPSLYREDYSKETQLDRVSVLVYTASRVYLNAHVTRGHIVNDLKQSLGKYLRITRNATSAGGSILMVQGILESIDEKSETFVLKSTTYDGQRDTVLFSDIGLIDKTKTGSGAASSVSAPGWKHTGYGEWTRTDK